MAMEKNLLSGSTAMLLLKLLEEKDRYGYEIMETLRSRSDHTFDLKAGTLYPLLHSLELKGFLESYENMESSKPRKYYKITKSGKKHLREKEEEWKQYTCAVNQVLGGVLFGVL